jgi:CheY-like chemotaxis protein
MTARSMFRAVRRWCGRERLAGIGDRMEIDASPGSGTRATLIAPCTGPEGRHDRDHAGEVPASGRTEGAGSRPLRVLLADDHALMRDGLRQLLSDFPQLTVVGEAADGVAAVAMAEALHPDVIVMDVAMPRMDGLEATRRIRASWPDITVLGLSTQERTRGPHAIEHAGAAGYFTKGDDARHLITQLLHLQAQLPRTDSGLA